MMGVYGVHSGLYTHVCVEGGQRRVQGRLQACGPAGDLPARACDECLHARMAERAETSSRAIQRPDHKQAAHTTCA